MTPVPKFWSVALLLSCIWISTSHSSSGENWPCWRGPRGDGSVYDRDAPRAWNGTTGKNIVWQKPLNGVGHSSPIIWDHRIFLTSCDEDSTERHLICLNRDDGSESWRTTVFDGQLESIHALNSRASSTPATDGKLVFVAFMQPDGRTVIAPNVGSEREITAGQMTVAAYNLDGEQQWSVKPGDFVSAHGFCSCPVLFDDMVIVNGDHDGDSYIVALDKQTGVQRWRRKRAHKTRSYVTPLIRKTKGRTQMVFSGSKHIISLDPRDGSEHWKIEGPTEQMVASMVFDGERFYMNCGYPDHFVLGIRTDGVGDVTETGVAWESRLARSYVPSPVVIENYLIVADDRGTANCFDSKSGKRLWQARMGNGFSASIIHANGLAYLTANNGETIVVKPGHEPEIVARNPLGEDVSASAAVSNGQLFLRSHQALYCIAVQ